MIFRRGVLASYRHVSLKILNEFPKVLDNVSLELGKQRDQFRQSIESKVDNPLMTIESFNRQFQVGEKEREGVGANDLKIKSQIGSQEFIFLLPNKPQ